MRILIGFSVCLLCFSCQKKAPQDYLIGAWKVDSTYTFYNNFSYTETKGGLDWATYIYEAAGVMKEIKYDSYQTYFFEIAADSITVRPTQGGDEISFQILQLSRDHLVLKKKKQPIFSGKNQDRYEIRYLSKTTIPDDQMLPFSDPRQ